MEEAAKPLLPNVFWAKDAYDGGPGRATRWSILTEWNEFRSLDFTRLGQSLKNRLIIDLRNIYNPAELAKAGFTYHSIGRAPILQEAS